MSAQDRKSLASRFDWITLSFISGYHLALLIALPLYLVNNTPSWALLGWTLFLVTACAMAITAGYHRLYSHRTYKAHKSVEAVLLFFGTLATEGSVWRWSHDHRLHHRHVDTEKDPYDTPKGFWHSHLLWMFKKEIPFDDRYLGDLRENALLRFQDRYYGILLAIANLLVLAGVYASTGDLFGSIVFAFLIRTFLVHHTTWFINSLAHMWGAKPYSSEHSAVNNFILAFLTFGEGYHNYHHTFAGDYRNGVRWWQFDPTKVLIWSLNKVGLTSDLKRMDAFMIKKRLLVNDRRLMINHLKGVSDIDVSVFVASVEKLAEKISGQISSARTTMEKYRATDRKRQRMEFKNLKASLTELRQELSRDFRTWNQMCRMVLTMPSTSMAH